MKNRGLCQGVPFLLKKKLNYFTYLCIMESLKIDRTKLITPSAYAKKNGITPAAVTKMMDTKRVRVVEINGGRLILED